MSRMDHESGTSVEVSVLLPAWNDELTVGRCLRSLAEISDISLEVIVCAGGTDGTAEIAQRFAQEQPDRFRFISQVQGEGKQTALFRCFGLALGEFIYLTDADCIVPESTLRTLLKVLRSSSADAVTGPTDPLPEQRSDSLVRHQWATTRSVDRTRSLSSTGIHGRNTLVKTSTIRECGGFSDPVRIGTDYHLGRKLVSNGFEIQFVDAAVMTEYEITVPGYIRQQSRWLRNVFEHASISPDKTESRSVARTIAVGFSLLFWPLTWRWTRLPGILLWALPYAAMVRTRLHQDQLLQSEKELPDLGFRIPHAIWFSAVDIVAWASPLIDMIFPSRKGRW